MAMVEWIAMAAISAALLYSGLRVVTTSNLVHTVLWLGVMLGATAICFVILRAPFLAAIQLLLYTGGVLTLMLFGVMLTHRKAGVSEVPNQSHNKGPGAALALAVFGTLTAAIATTEGLPAERGANISTKSIGEAFLTEHVLAFEVLSILLLAAVLGAIVLARRNDPSERPDRVEDRIPGRKPVPIPSRDAESEAG